MARIQSIHRAVEVLKALGNDINTIAEITREVNLSKSTVHRLLKSLEDSNLVIQNTIDKKYYLGSLLTNLASKPLTAHKHLISCTHEKMRYLRKVTGESVTLHIRLGNQRVLLQEIVGSEDIKYMGRPLKGNPLWAGSVGKVLLSQLPEYEIKTILNNTKLLPLTEFTITDHTVFWDEIMKTKTKGYATNVNEVIVGVAGISVPVFDYVAPAALSLIGNEHSFQPRMLSYVDELHKLSDEITQNLRQSENSLKSSYS